MNSLAQLRVGDTFRSNGKTYCVLALSKAFNPIEKANPYHDAKGRFSNFLQVGFKATSEFIHGKSARQVLISVAKHPKTKQSVKDLVALALSSIVGYAAKNGSWNTLHGPDVDEYISYVVHNLSTTMGVPKEQTKTILKSSVAALKSLRNKQPEIKKDLDPVLEILTQLKEAIDLYAPDMEKVNTSGVKVDLEHDGPWMSCMSQDGKTMYQNKNLPEKTTIKDKEVIVSDMLLQHEVAEKTKIDALLQDFKDKEGREPNEEERKTLYLKAHNEAGTPTERAYAKDNDIDWDAWSAWCRGQEAQLEKESFTNQPKDADVKPIPHGHGDLEITNKANPYHDKLGRFTTAAIEKFNPHHDERGRFATSDSAKGSAVALLRQNLKPELTLDDVLKIIPGDTTTAIARAKELIASNPSTKEQHTTADGQYTPARQALHKNLLEHLFRKDIIQAATPDPGKAPELIMTGGRPGSGKTSALEGIDKSKYFYLSADTIRESMPGYNGANAELYLPEARDLVAQAERIARSAGLNIIYDATMAVTQQAQERVAAYKAAGYDVKGYYVHAAPETATSRAMSRFMSTGYFVPPEVPFNQRTNEQTFDTLKPSLKHWVLIDNNGSKAKIVAEGGQP